MVIRRVLAHHECLCSFQSLKVSLSLSNPLCQLSIQFYFWVFILPFSVPLLFLDLTFIGMSQGCHFASSFQLDSVEWLQSLLRCCCSCWARLFLKGLLQLVSPLQVSLALAPRLPPCLPLPQSCCQYTGHMCQTSSPYLRPVLCLGVTVLATVRTPLKKGEGRLFSRQNAEAGWRWKGGRKIPIALILKQLLSAQLTPWTLM